MKDYSNIYTGTKILKHLDKIYSFAKTGFIYPVTVEIDLTNACDQHCLRCTSNQERTHYLSEDQAMQIIDSLVTAGVKGIKLVGGGEPTLSPILGDVVEYAVKNGLAVGMITNGKYLPNHKQRSLLMCDWIRISLDAHDQKSYSISHGDNCFNKVVENIRTLTQERSHEKCTIGIAILYDDFIVPGDAVKIAEYIGADYILFRPYNDHREPFKRDYDLLKILKSDSTSVLVSEFKKDETRNYDICYGSWFTSVIGADLKVYNCCHYRNSPKNIIGDLNKEWFNKIWRKDNIERVLSNIDVTQCPICCYHNSNNNLLHIILKEDIPHKNVL